MNIINSDIKEILIDHEIPWHTLRNCSILIAGANSMLAKYMILTLLYLNINDRFNCNIICLLRNKNNFFLQGKIKHKNLILIEHDIAHPLSYDGEIDYIVHAASKASNKFFYKNPTDVILANTNGTYNLLQLALEKNVKGFLFFSSGEVYGNFDTFTGPIHEKMYGRCDPLDVRNCYAESKRMAESMCACWAYQFGLSTKIVRISHTYGPTLNLDDERIFSYITSQIVNNKDIIFHSNGTPRRPFCYITDATRAFFLILLKGTTGEAYNLSPGYTLSIREVAEIAIKASGNTATKIHCSKTPSSTELTSSNCFPSNAKLIGLGWKHLVSESEGFRRTIEFFKSGGIINEECFQ